ncbi:MAG: riboflavin synthase [Tissierellales bacterium]|nr:riboflavin synthase [Tissierellales bacterium]
MFTGLIEEVGEITSVTRKGNSAQITVKAGKILKDTKIGDSISTNGVCLTVTEKTSNTFTVDVMPETMNRSNLKNFKYGSKVNLERALRVGDRLDGHMVSGHVDGLGKIANYLKEDNAVWITVEADKSLLKYIIEKGSIAIDGTSLTVAYVDDRSFKVSIIPHTGEATTLLDKKIGDEVNLECDMVGKYIEKFMKFEENKSEESNSNLNEDFLRQNGFM